MARATIERASAAESRIGPVPRAEADLAALTLAGQALY
jgi:hypothetical protein